MEYLWLSLLAGVLTILAPCVLPLLPVIIGGSLTDRDPWRPVIITLSLAVSIVLFTLLLKFSTALIDIPPAFWRWFSGGIILFFAWSLLCPRQWEFLALKLKLGAGSQQLLQKSSSHRNRFGMIMMGAALGPVFASCSPTFFVILSTVVPASFWVGVLNLVAYALGLSIMMGLVAWFGQRLVAKLRVAADPHGIFKKILGLLFLIVGLAVLTGYDKTLEAIVIDKGWFDVGSIERHWLSE